MKLRDDKTFKVASEANGSYEMMEMHLFDNNARKENALCGADTSSDGPERRERLSGGLCGLSVGAVCEGCKTLAVPLPRT